MEVSKKTRVLTIFAVNFNLLLLGLALLRPPGLLPALHLNEYVHSYAELQVLLVVWYLAKILGFYTAWHLIKDKVEKRNTRTLLLLYYISYKTGTIPIDLVWRLGKKGNNKEIIAGMFVLQCFTEFVLTAFWFSHKSYEVLFVGEECRDVEDYVNAAIFIAIVTTQTLAVYQMVVYAFRLIPKDDDLPSRFITDVLMMARLRGDIERTPAEFGEVKLRQLTTDTPRRRHPQGVDLQPATEYDISDRSPEFNPNMQQLTGRRHFYYDDSLVTTTAAGSYAGVSDLHDNSWAKTFNSQDVTSALAAIGQKGTMSCGTYDPSEHLNKLSKKPLIEQRLNYAMNEFHEPRTTVISDDDMVLGYLDKLLDKIDAQ